MALIHCTRTEFAAFAPTKQGRTAAEDGVIWLGNESIEHKLVGLFGDHVAECEILGEAEDVDYTEFDEDGDSMYVPETMARALSSTDAPIVRIRKVQMTEHGRRTSVYAVRDAHLVRIVSWRSAED